MVKLSASVPDDLWRLATAYADNGGTSAVIQTALRDFVESKLERCPVCDVPLYPEWKRCPFHDD